MATAFSFDTDTKKYMKAMRRLGNDALPNAVADTLNITADAVTKQQIRNAKKEFTIRTQFTLNSMKSGRAKPYKALNKAIGTNMQRMFSRAGTFSKYLWKQENGGTFKGINGPVPIPTLNARTGKSNKKAIAKRYRLNKSTQLTDGNIDNDQFVGTINGKRGVYRRMKKGKLQMIRNLDSDSVRIKGTNFHQDAVDKLGTPRFVSAVFRREAKKEIAKVVRRG